MFFTPQNGVAMVDAAMPAASDPVRQYVTRYLLELSERYAVTGPHTGYGFEILPNPRGRYYRIAATNLWDGTEIEHSRSVVCFVDSFGNVYKADGWKRPTLGPRARLASMVDWNLLRARMTHELTPGACLTR